MKKKIITLVIFATIFIGCENEEKVTTMDLNETPPIDIPIAKSDANVSIDENLPPEPVTGGWDGI